MFSKKRLAINGFGRIGRAAFKASLFHKDVEVVAINDLTDATTLAHLLKYDSVYGQLDAKIFVKGNNLVVDGITYPVFSEKDPSLLPWQKLKVDTVLECTGIFRTKDSAGAHITAGAKKVIISAPSKDKDTQTYVLGVNEKTYKKEAIIDNASCTTNCVSPILAVLMSKWGIKKAMMTTIHSYTADQNLVDGPHKDLHRARAAALNIIPTSTGAAEATAETIPQLKGKFDGMSIRVPTPVVSLSDFTMLLNKKVTVEEINKAFKEAVKSSMYKDILAVTEEPLVSSDFIGDPHSATVDLSLTQVVDGDLVKVVAWYDNEWGYANRLVEMAVLIA